MNYLIQMYQQTTWQARFLLLLALLAYSITVYAIGWMDGMDHRATRRVDSDEERA